MKILKKILYKIYIAFIVCSFIPPSLVFFTSSKCKSIVSPDDPYLDYYYQYFSKNCTEEELEFLYSNTPFKNYGDVYSSPHLAYVVSRTTVPDEDEVKKESEKNRKKYEEQVQDLYQLINEYRESKGLSTLKYSKDLEYYASLRATENAMASWMGYDQALTKHFRPNGRRVWSIIPENSKYNNFSKSEIIAATGINNNVSYLKCWKSSPPHNSSILDSSNIEMGVGIAYDNVAKQYQCIIWFTIDYSEYSNTSS